MLDLGEIGQVETVLEDAVTKHPTCVSLWKRRLEMMIGTNTSKEVVLKTFKKARKRVPEKVKMKREFLGDLRSLGGHFLKINVFCQSVCLCVSVYVSFSENLFCWWQHMCSEKCIYTFFFQSFVVKLG